MSIPNYYSEESKPDSDLDEPWIMTVKGLNFSNFTKQAALMSDESIVASLKHNGSNNGSSRDSNLNHYKLSQVREPEPNIVNFKINLIFFI